MALPSDHYPDIFLAGTDYDLKEFDNSYNKYTNFREAGRGGNGVLYFAYDNNLGRDVIVKRLPEQLEDSPTEQRRFLREARVTSQLQHPNTVPVYEIGRDDRNRLYFTMKRIRGHNLFAMLSGIARGDEGLKKQFTIKRLLAIYVQICRVLTYAHAHGVIHRDVKPENIMVGLFDEVILMDWGVAKVWGQPDDEEGQGSHFYDRLTSTGQRPGTPLYMSPEQVLGNRPVDERTDIFSMGVVLYEMLSIREPFRGHSVKHTFDNIIHETPEPPSKVAQHFKVPEEIDAICFKAIEKDPANRFQFMNELHDVVNALLEKLD